MKPLHHLLLVLPIACASPLAAEEFPALSKPDVAAKLELLRTGKTPNIYGAVYYPEWQQALDGLRSITAEAVAEHASLSMKDAKVHFEVLSEPLTRGRTAMVRLKRTTADHAVSIKQAYLHLNKGGKHWDLLVLPIPYQAPKILPKKDRQFMDAALNVEYGFESKLYEFDEATLANFKALQKLGAAEDVKAVEIGEMVLAIGKALKNHADPESMQVVEQFGTDSRYYTMIRGWLSQELRGAESQLSARRDERPQALMKKVEFLKKAIRRIDLE